MKDIKDYLHLYLGCEVKTNDRDLGQGRTHYGRTGTFIGFTDHTRLHCRIAHRAGPEGCVNIHLLKPVLRPLSDMTEEEAVEYCKLQTEEKRWMDIEIHEILPTHIEFIDGSMWHGDGVSELNDLRADFNEARPEQFRYLLSKGFDLFGLIEAGLAIDKTKQHNQ